MEAPGHRAQAGVCPAGKGRAKWRALSALPLGTQVIGAAVLLAAVDVSVQVSITLRADNLVTVVFLSKLEEGKKAQWCSPQTKPQVQVRSFWILQSQRGQPSSSCWSATIGYDWSRGLLSLSWILASTF